MITRNSLHHSEPTALFGELTNQTYLTEKQLMVSLEQFLAKRPTSEPVWVFAYGSLIWNPVLNFSERQIGYIAGLERAFCMKLTIGRGSDSLPGRMLGLIPGKGTHGILLRIEEASLLEELKLLWKREMSVNSYLPEWVRAELADGRTVDALAFVMSDGNESYDAIHDPSYVANFIFKASGPLGTNLEYLEKLYSALTDNDIADPYITNVVTEVRKKIANSR